MLSDVFGLPRAAESGAAPEARSTRAATTSALGTVGVAALVLALVPLVGWAAGWPPLAAYVTGWPVVSPVTGLLLLVLAIGMAAQTGDTTRASRRIVLGGAGAVAAVVGLLWLFALPAPTRGLDAVALVQRWHGSPGELLQAGPSALAIGATTALAAALFLLALRGTGTTRAAWLTAGAAAVIALVAAAPRDPGSAVGTGAAPFVAVAIPPSIALVVLLLASVILVERAPDGGWWVPSRGVAVRLARAALPGVLVAPPALVWLGQLAEQRRLVGADVARPALSVALVLVMAAVVAAAGLEIVRAEESTRRRGERRMQRVARRGAEQAARQADHTVRVTAERYRTHLRQILEVSPAAFVALDREGHVTYLNGAAAELLDCRVEDAVGRPMATVWPDLGEEVRRALGLTVGGATIVRTVTSARSGARYELRGYPDETGIALFVTALDAG